MRERWNHRLVRRFAGAVFVVLLVGVIPAVMSGASQGPRKVAQREARATLLLGSDAKQHMARTHAHDPAAKAMWDRGVARLSARGKRLNGNLKAVQMDIVTKYEPTGRQTAMHFVRNLFNPEVRASVPSCEEYPDLCEIMSGGSMYSDDYDTSAYNSTGLFAQGTTYMSSGNSTANFDITVYTDPNDPWNFGTVEYGLNSNEFSPEGDNNERTFHGVPCSQRGNVGMKLAQLTMEKAAIAAIAGAIAGSFATPAGALAGAVAAFNVTGTASLLWYIGEEFVICKLGWGSSLLETPPVMELTLGVPSGRQ